MRNQPLFALLCPTLLVFFCDNNLCAQRVGIGTIAPSANLHVAPNSNIAALRVDQGTLGNGIFCYVNTTSASRTVFSAGSNVTGLTILGDGNVGIGTVNPVVTFQVQGSGAYTGHFQNLAESVDNFCLVGRFTNTAGYGMGIEGAGGGTGIYGHANMSGGVYDRMGVDAYAANGTANFGVYSEAQYGTTSYGIFGKASGATTNWAGYFQGNVYSTGTYQGSDRKLKNNVAPIEDALRMIDKLKPAAYTFKTDEYSSLQLPEGLQYGLVADELKEVMPGLVKKAIQPAEYENRETRKGKVISEAVEFDAVNYTALIPLLIAAVKEQQALIASQQQQIGNLTKETAELKKRLH